MNVEELIKMLQDVPKDTIVLVWDFGAGDPIEAENIDYDDLSKSLTIEATAEKVSND